MRSSRSPVHVKVYTILTAALCLLGTAPAQAAPSNPGSAKTNKIESIEQLPITQDAKDLLRRQAPLVEIVDQLGAVMGEKGANYAGIEISAEQSTVRIYWRGLVPQALSKRIAGLNSAQHGIRIMVQPAQYARSELMAEATRLISSDPAIAQIGLRTDGSGLDVVLDERDSQIHPLAVPSSLPVTVNWGPRPASAVGRWADIPAFFGGNAMQTPSGTPGFVFFCSSGFSATRLGHAGLITADHCGSTGANWATPQTQAAASRPIGTSVAQLGQAQLDLRFLNVESSDNFIYAGGPDPSGLGTGEGGLEITGVAPTTVKGELVCQSGSFSGTRCTIQVGDLQVVHYPTGEVYSVVSSRTTDGSEAVGEGDSGGPVFDVTTDQFRAYRIVSGELGGADEVPCIGVILEDRVCSRALLFAQIQLVSDFNATVKTS